MLAAQTAEFGLGGLASTAASAAYAAPAAVATSSVLDYVSLGTQVYSMVGDAYTARAQAQYNKSVAEYNAAAAKAAERAARIRGEQEIRNIRRVASDVEGTQRAMMAARGLTLTSGSSQRIVDQTRELSQEDVRSASYNAEMDAYRNRLQSLEYETAAKYISPSKTFTSTLISGALPVAEKWYRRSKGVF